MYAQITLGHAPNDATRRDWHIGVDIIGCVAIWRISTMELPDQIELSCHHPLDEITEFLGGKMEIRYVRMSGIAHDNHAVLRRYLNAFLVLAEARLTPI
jgi:hypothetical protein